MLDWSDYLLPPESRHAAATRAQLAANQQQEQQQQQQVDAQDAADADAAPPAPASTVDATVEAATATTAAQQQQQQQQSTVQEAAVSVQQPQQQGAAGSREVLPAQQDEQHQLLQHSSIQQQQQQQAQPHQPQPVQWYEDQDNYGLKVLGLVLALLATMVLLNTLLFTLPVGVGRALLTALRLPFKNDLFTGIIGLLVLSGGYSFAAAVASSASFMNLRTVAAAAWRWGVLMGQCAVLLVLWLGVVATMLGMLCELVLLPLRLPPNQTALIYLYQVRQG
jgi:hypothetical protein